jgi:hypothetical protein
MIRIAISVRQPMAWAIVAGRKDIENRSLHAVRTWRGMIGQRILIHASKTDVSYDSGERFMRRLGVGCPPLSELERGGVVGSVVIDSIVETHPSDWFTGPYGLVLRDPERLPFRPCRGQLGVFRVEV